MAASPRHAVAYEWMQHNGVDVHCYCSAHTPAYPLFAALGDACKMPYKGSMLRRLVDHALLCLYRAASASDVIACELPTTPGPSMEATLGVPTMVDGDGANRISVPAAASQSGHWRERDEYGIPRYVHSLAALYSDPPPDHSASMAIAQMRDGARIQLRHALFELDGLYLDAAIGCSWESTAVQVLRSAVVFIARLT